MQQLPALGIAQMTMTPTNNDNQSEISNLSNDVVNLAIS